MNKTSKIMLIVWSVLSIICFVCGFFCPLIPKIFILVHGGFDIMIILSLVITFLQDLFIKKNIESVQLQEEDKEETYTEETSGE